MNDLSKTTDASQSTATASSRGRGVHPGAGRRKALSHAKGRVLDPQEVERARAHHRRSAVRAAAADRIPAPDPGRRRLPAAGLMQGARRADAHSRWPRSTRSRRSMRTSTSSTDGEPRPAPVTIRVCDSLSCMLAGAEQLIAELGAESIDGRARRARALHRVVPHRAGRRGRSSSCRSRDARQGQGAGAAEDDTARVHPALSGVSTPIAPAAATRFCGAASAGERTVDERDRDAVRRRLARPRRRGLPHGPQVELGARRAGAAR